MFPPAGRGWGQGEGPKEICLTAWISYRSNMSGDRNGKQRTFKNNQPKPLDINKEEMPAWAHELTQDHGQGANRGHACSQTVGLDLFTHTSMCQN